MLVYNLRFKAILLYNMYLGTIETYSYIQRL